MTTYYVYILECQNASYYTGYTTDLERRYQEHQAGSAKCKYTRSFPPIRLAVSWNLGENLTQAMQIERKIKSLSKSEKTNLINNPDSLFNLINQK